MVQIVKAKQLHVPEIVTIWKELMDFHKKRDPFFTRKADGHYNFEKYVKKLMGSKSSQVLVALDGEKVVAFSTACVSQYPPVLKRTNYGLISNIAVKEKYRRREIGENILSEIKKWFSKQGITRIELRTSSENEVARSFWAKHGFKEYERIMYLDI